jgi:hypothetical protein
MKIDNPKAIIVIKNEMGFLFTIFFLACFIPVVIMVCPDGINEWVPFSIITITSFSLFTFSFFAYREFHFFTDKVIVRRHLKILRIILYDDVIHVHHVYGKPQCLMFVVKEKKKLMVPMHRGQIEELKSQVHFINQFKL